MLNPSDSIVDWVLKTVPTMGAGWCPPGMLGIGIGGTAEKAMLMAKESLMAPIDMDELLQRGPSNKIEELRIELYEKVNALGIGAQGLGGLTTVLDVKIAMYPTHAAGKPVAMIPNCAATRHAHFVLDGSRAGVLRAAAACPTGRRSNWAPDYQKSREGEPRHADARRGRVLEAGPDAAAVGQDADRPRRRAQAHPGHAGHAARRCRSNSPTASSTTSARWTRCATRSSAPPARPPSTRMDKFTEMMLSQTGLIAMIGKAERGPAAIEAIRKHKAAYLMAVGGAAYLVSKAIKQREGASAFADLGMEAIYEFDVKDMPVTVAVDSSGTSVHETGPREWQARIGKIPVSVA